MIRILFRPSVSISYLPVSIISSSPLYQITSAPGLETSHASFIVSPSLTSTLVRFFVKTASSSARRIKKLSQIGYHCFFPNTNISVKEDFTLTQYCQHARSSRCPHFTGIFCLIIQETLVDDKNAHCSLRDDVILFALFNFSPIFKPLNLYSR